MAGLELTASFRGNDNSWITDKVMYQDRVYTQGYATVCCRACSEGNSLKQRHARPRNGILLMPAKWAGIGSRAGKPSLPVRRPC